MSVASFLVLFCTFFYCIRRRKFSECVGTCFGEINRLDLLTSNLIVTVKLSVKQACVIILLVFLQICILFWAFLCFERLWSIPIFYLGHDLDAKAFRSIRIIWQVRARVEHFKCCIIFGLFFGQEITQTKIYKCQSWLNLALGCTGHL